MKKTLLLTIGAILTIAACSSFKDLRQADLIKGQDRKTYESRGKKYMISTQGTSTTKAAQFAFVVEVPWVEIMYFLPRDS